MIRWTYNDMQMLAHVVDVVGDQMLNEDGYTDQDRKTMAKLEALAQAGASLTVDGSKVERNEAAQTFVDIVRAELDNWVPDASQRLLYRAGAALGISQPDPGNARQPDCGPHVGDHAIISDWIAGLYVQRCVNCFRIFKR